MRPANAKSDRGIYLFMVGCFFGAPLALSAMKGIEKRKLWPPVAAEIEAIDQSATHQHVTYRYEHAGRTYRHTQRDSVPGFLGKRHEWIPYAKGDKIYVHVHSRNPKLSILDPPIFQRLWRDFGHPYRGEEVRD